MGLIEIYFHTRPTKGGKIPPTATRDKPGPRAPANGTYNQKGTGGRARASEMSAARLRGASSWLEILEEREEILDLGLQEVPKSEDVSRFYMHFP